MAINLISSHEFSLKLSFPPAHEMLLLRSCPNLMFMGSAPSHSESRTELDLPIWNLNRSVNNISGYGNSNPYLHLRNGTIEVLLFCTSRASRLAHVSECKSVNGGSGIKRRGGNCEPDDDENSKNCRNMYYQTIMEANPGNPLLLSNYAKFLHEVQHNMEKAEENYKMAILASPGDAEVVSLYANFIWETYKDAASAEVYFDQALNLASPDDCYIHASYAHFLWNCEEDEEDHKDGPADLQSVIATNYGGSVSAAAAALKL